MQTTRRLPHSSWNAISEKKPQKNTFNDSPFKILGFFLASFSIPAWRVFLSSDIQGNNKTNQQTKKKKNPQTCKSESNEEFVTGSRRWAMVV